MAKKKEPVASLLVPVEEQPYKIPDNWCWTYGGTVLEAMESQKPIGEEFDYIDIDAIDNQKQTVNSPKRLPVSKAPSRASRKLHAGDTVFSLVRPYLKNIAYIDDSLAHCIASTGFFVCTPKSFLNSRYLYQIMISPYMVDGLNQYMKGDNSPSIRKDDIEQFPFPLPTLPEQQRIVDRIESLFAKLDEAKEKAQAVVDGFELRKSAILHKAFTGELTERWRTEHGEEIKNWEYRKLSDMATVISGYAFSSNDLNECNNVPCIKITNVGVGSYISEDYEYLPDKFLDVYKRFKVSAGDILISLTRSYIAAGLKVCICSEPRDALLNQRVALIKNCNTRYVYYYLRSTAVLTYVKEKSKTTNQPNLSIKDLNNLLIPVPDEREQSKIVSILNDLLDKAEHAKSVAEAVLDQIDTMKKAILVRAFRGELGTNDPAEEWAGELVKTVL